MSPIKKARRLLHEKTLTAAAVQLLLTGARLMILLAQLILLRFVGLGTEQAISVSRLWSGQWLYGIILLLALIADWLLISPLLLGLTAFYYGIARGGDADFTTLFRFFRRDYTRTLKWRLQLFWRRLLWSGICLLPSAAVLGYAGIVRVRQADGPLADITLTLCTLFGVFFLLAGSVVYGLIMLRYLPASYLLVMNEGEAPPKKLFREASRVMHTHIGETAWLYLRFSGWFVALLAVLPYFYAAPLFHTARASVLNRYISEQKQKTEISRGDQVPDTTMSFDIPQGFVRLPHGLT